MTRNLSALALVFGLAAGGAAAGPADTSAALNACANGFPDHTRIAAGFLAAGFVELGAVQSGSLDLTMFHSADGKTYVATRGQTESGLRCFIVEDRLTVRRAEGMAEGLAKVMTGATELAAPGGGEIEITKYIAGMYRDRTALVAVLRGYEIPGKIKGAGLMVMTQ